MLDVESSNVAQVGYSVADGGTLFVRFKPRANGQLGGLYTYIGVAYQFFEEMQRPGGSVGKAINSIKLSPDIICKRVEEAEDVV